VITWVGRWTKKGRKIEEKKIDEKQAVVWKEDTDAFFDNEK